MAEVFMRIVGIIPARWASTRLPGKPLADLNGRPLIEHVWRRASRAKRLTRLLVATDDQRIAQAVRAFGGEAVMTPASCASGTDRLAWVARTLSCDVVVNIQGDEPFLSPGDVDQLVQPFEKDRKLLMSTLAAPLPSADFQNPNAVKVVCNRAGQALYFSRAPIPFPRDQKKSPALLHIGMYAYRKSFLLQYAGWPRTRLEKIEQLEQLRALEHGAAIQVVRVAKPTLSVDTPRDLEQARYLLKTK
jgi:3-deoxy-manno-octulosonate cytidylyltransferase (CMP-KDO synthetase)